MEERKKFGDLLKQLRKAAKLSQEGFLNGLAYLIHESIEKQDDALIRLGADLGRADEALLFSKTDVSKYENGKAKPARNRVLLFIFYFKQKEVIQLEDANLLLNYLEYASLAHAEQLCIFRKLGEEIQVATVAEHDQSTNHEVAALQEGKPLRPIKSVQLKWVAGVALLILMLLVVWWRYGPINTLTSLSVDEQPSSTTATMSVLTPVLTKDWCDDFEDRKHDINRWQKPRKFGQISATPVKGDLIYEQDGVLNFHATLEQTKNEGVWGDQSTTSFFHPIKEISFKITLVSDETNDVSAGTSISALLEDGRDFVVSVDLGSDDRRYVYEICSAPRCGAAETYNTIKEGKFPIGSPVPMRIVWANDKIQFYIDDVLQVEPLVQHKQIARLQVSTWANKNSAFHTTIDDVCVKYL